MKELTFGSEEDETLVFACAIHPRNPGMSGTQFSELYLVPKVRDLTGSRDASPNLEEMPIFYALRCVGFANGGNSYLLFACVKLLC